MWTMTTPKRALFTLGTIAPALLLGIVITSHGPLSTAPTPLDATKSSLTQTVDPAPTDDSSAPSSDATTPPAPTDQASAPTDDQSAAPSGQQQVQTDTGTDPTPPADPPAAPVATSAALSDWTAPVPGTRPNATAGGMVQYRYCVYTYSDGSTQEQLYQTKYTSQGVSAM